MNCAKARLHSVDAPEELHPGLRRDLEKHLERCAGCREAAERLRAVGRLVALKSQERPEPALMDSFLARFHQRLRMERTIRVRTPTSRWTWLWAEPAVVLRTAFATLLLAVAGGRILIVGLRGGGAPLMAQEPIPLEIPSASHAWIGPSGTLATGSGSDPIIIIRPKSARDAEPRRNIYERGSIVPASYEF